MKKSGRNKIIFTIILISIILILGDIAKKTNFFAKEPKKITEEAQRQFTPNVQYTGIIDSGFKNKTQTQFGIHKEILEWAKFQNKNKNVIGQGGMGRANIIGPMTSKIETLLIDVIKYYNNKDSNKYNKSITKLYEILRKENKFLDFIPRKFKNGDLNSNFHFYDAHMKFDNQNTTNPQNKLYNLEEEYQELINNNFSSIKTKIENLFSQYINNYNDIIIIASWPDSIMFDLKKAIKTYKNPKSDTERTYKDYIGSMAISLLLDSGNPDAIDIYRDKKTKNIYIITSGKNLKSYNLSKSKDSFSDWNSGTTKMKEAIEKIASKSKTTNFRLRLQDPASERLYYEIKQANREKLHGTRNTDITGKGISTNYKDHANRAYIETELNKTKYTTQPRVYQRTDEKLKKHWIATWYRQK